MITAVDTNVLIDVFKADDEFGEHSKKLLSRCMQEGALIASEIVWAETASVFPKESAFLKAVRSLGVAYSSLSEEAATTAGTTWHRYRARGGKKDRIVADFLIGAHAMTHADRLLTRDRGFYRAYFKGLQIVR